MRLLYIVPDVTGAGGIARVISLKLDYLLTRTDCKIDIISLNSTKKNCFYGFNKKINWHTINHSKNSIFFLKSYFLFIKEVISKVEPDIIVVCDANFWYLFPWFIKFEIPIIFETHVSKFLEKSDNESLFRRFISPLINPVKRKTFKKFDKVIFLSQDCSDEWELKNNVVIPNPVTFFVEKESSLNNNRAIAIARHSYEKGIDRLLMIWKNIIKEHPDWCLDIYGEWNGNNKYQLLAIDLGISNSVNFFPPTLDIKDKYLESSIYLMASRSEALPLVLIEAMNCGLPCVSYDCPSGPRNIIEDNENGFLIEDGNSTDFEKKVALLIEDKELRIRMGKKAKLSIEKYQIDKVMNQWDDLFQDISLVKH
ncbi:glycosyltransferase family 4 protein [Flavobacterium aestivum]|uniref:glycosyltransferase family 4 protein n=1 Tax=Flavobacterium aestivum TaxID=3003257 RepID=UPI0024831075|nr:glycosyltransferase family 4 protein [Flavobacterium aestivum]